MEFDIHGRHLPVTCARSLPRLSEHLQPDRLFDRWPEPQEAVEEPRSERSKGDHGWHGARGRDDPHRWRD